MKSMREELIAHLGGKPTIAQQILVEQACALRLRLALMEAERLDEAEPGRWAERGQIQYLAWSGALTRIIRDLGLESAQVNQPDLENFGWDLPRQNAAVA